MSEPSVLLSETTTRFLDSDRLMIRSRLSSLSEGSDIEFNPGELTGEQRGWLFSYRYEWEIRAGNQSYELVERQFVDKSWLYLLTAFTFCTGIGLWLLTVVMGVSHPDNTLIYNMTSFLERIMITIGSLCLVLSLITGFVLYPGVIPNTRGVSEGYTFYSPFFVPYYLTGLLTVVAIVGRYIGSTDLIVVASAGLLTVGGSLLYSPELFKEESKWLRSKNPLTDLPPVVGEYLLIISAPIFLVFSAMAWLSLSVSSTVITGLSGLVFVLIVYAEFRWILGLAEERGLDTYNKIERSQKSISYGGIRIAYFVAAVGLSYVLVLGTGLILTRNFDALVSFSQNPFHSVMIAVSVLPTGYYITGLAYQTVAGIREKQLVFSKSSEFEESFDTSAKVLRVDSKRESPLCLSTGFNDYIFIPSDVEAVLSHAELEAVVAHEEKHIRDREAVLFFFMPVISLGLFTGQNVIYSLLDFRSREFEADRYARRQTSETAVISALQSISKLERDSDSMLTQWQRYFSMFYGTYARSQAHPSIEARKDRLSD